MLKLSGDCFNGLYLRALNIAVSATRTFEASRVGPVINLGQAYFEVSANDPRLIFLNHRKLNPVFAVVEGAWVLSGSNKLIPLENEFPDFRSYSDDGETLNGAYGDRLQYFFGINQISSAVELLKADHNTRRVVLTIYSPFDLIKDSKDIPCNTTVYLKISNNKLDITVLNRSNDLYLGVPYNVFVFGLLQRYISRVLGVRIGKQCHFTDSLHLYQDYIKKAERIVSDNNIEAVRLISNKFTWEYSDAIIDNIEAIIAGKFNAVQDNKLSLFLLQFCKKNREQCKAIRSQLKFSDDFFGFLAYQWLYPGQQNDELWEIQRKMMMCDNVKQKIEQLGKLSGQEIADKVMELAEQLKGNLKELKEAIEKKSGPYSLRDYDGNEEITLKMILLSAVWTTLDPYLASTPIGARAKQEIKVAANLLNVPSSDLGPLTTVEDELFSTLSKLLN